MSLQKKCLTASAITHGLLVVLVFVGSAFIPHKPVLEGPEFEIFTLPQDFDLVAQDNVFSGGDPNARKGSGVQQVPQPQPPPPQPKQEQPKQEVPVVKPPEPKVEPKVEQKQPEKIEVKPKVDPDAFNLDKAITKKAETKKPEPKIDFKTIQKLAEKKTITTSSSDSKAANKTPSTETKVAFNTGLLADARKKLESGLSPGGSPAGRGDVDDILGPGGARVASYSLYLAGIYRDAWVAPTKSSARTPVRVRVRISKDGTVLEKQVISRSGNGDFDRAANDTVARVRKFDRPPPTNEPSVTYTLEFTPPE